MFYLATKRQKKNADRFAGDAAQNDGQQVVLMRLCSLTIQSTSSVEPEAESSRLNFRNCGHCSAARNHFWLDPIQSRYADRAIRQSFSDTSYLAWYVQYQGM